MDDEQFDWLVARLENEAANAPRAFRAKVFMISVAAYVVLFLSLLAIALLLAWAFVHTRTHGVNRGVIGIAVVGVMTLPVFWVTLRALLMRLPPPGGRAITRKEAPVLFGFLDKMRARLKGPAIHHVLVDTAYNACIMQRPRWGLLGPSVNYLVLGLPLMLGQSTSEMLAVVAHEYGHLCGAHGRASAWIYRQRMLFGAVHERVRDSADASLWHMAMVRALDAFAPYYNAYTFVLARQEEYEADHTAAGVVGAPAMASSLVRLTLLGQWLREQFWPTLYKQADMRERPAILPYKSMATAFRMSHDDWATDAQLGTAWKGESDSADTHPCLRARVEALGQTAALPTPLQSHAAASLLGPFGERLADEFDQAWWREEEQPWGKRHRHVTRGLARLRALQPQPLAALPLDELQEMAMLKFEFESAQAARPVLEHLLRQPGGPFPLAAFAYGRILLEEGRNDGLDYLATAARHDKRLADEALHTGYQFLMARDGSTRAEQWVEAAASLSSRI